MLLIFTFLRWGLKYFRLASTCYTVDDLELVVLLAPPPKSRDCRCGILHQGSGAGDWNQGFTSDKHPINHASSPHSILVFKSLNKSGVGTHTHIIPVRRLREEDHKSETSLGYIRRPSQNQKTNNFKRILIYFKASSLKNIHLSTYKNCIYLQLHIKRTCLIH